MDNINRNTIRNYIAEIQAECNKLLEALEKEDTCPYELAEHAHQLRTTVDYLVTRVDRVYGANIQLTYK